jgi:bla regulator protein blaR1
MTSIIGNGFLVGCLEYHGFGPEVANMSVLLTVREKATACGRCILLAVGGIAAIGFLYVPPARAQALTGRPQFETASVKPSSAQDVRPLFDIKPELFRASNVTVSRLIQVAYGVEGFQVAGGPPWAGSDLFDIRAKPEAPAKPDQLNLMLRSLLAERFHLAIRRETRDMPGYALLVAKSGAKFKEASASNPQEGRRPVMRIRRGLLVAEEIGAAALAVQLSMFLGRTVVDKTGLTGKYDFKLEWSPDENQAAMFQAARVPEGHGAPPADPLGASLFTALQEQLGLRLESQKAPTEVLVIERIDRPSAN